MTLGQKIKVLREKQGVSREDFAKKLGVSYWTLSKYETNERRPDYTTLSKMAYFFDVSTDYLLGRTDNFDSINLRLGERLKELRIKNNLTKREVANRIGLEPVTYSHFEIGTKIPSLEIMGKLASLFGITIDYLWAGKTDELLDPPLQVNKELTDNQNTNQSEIEELTKGLDEESMEELYKFIKYLYTRQTLSPNKDESSAGLDGEETGKK